MREILFKAKRKDNGEWVYWNIYGMICNKNGKLRRLSVKRNLATTSYYHYIHQIITLIDENTICRYTGLTDKNGNKIWENDVIQYIDGNLICNGIIKFGRHVQIVMIELGFYVDWLGKETESFKTDICYWTEKRDVKVIGNIFDNLEMIGE